eukprot:6585686-Pyramimonas_sp.AAC.1
MMQAAPGQDVGKADVFDFKAGFPSVLRAFLQEPLGAIGLPACVLGFVTALCQQNKCVVVAGRWQHKGFELLAGIRQGCPLSPLLFSAATGVFSTAHRACGAMRHSVRLRRQRRCRFCVRFYFALSDGA